MNKKIPIILSILIVCCIIGIFLFSNMDSQSSNGRSKKVISKTIEITLKITNKIGLTDKHPSKNKINRVSEKLNLPFRKCMHMAEYCVLAMFIIFLIRITRPMPLLKTCIIAIIISFLYACVDEFHQLFVNGRTSQFLDCLIDTSGAVVACIIYGIGYNIKNIINKKR